MNLKQIFKPTWRKLVFPIIIILLSAVVLGTTFKYSQTIGEFTCNFSATLDQAESLRNQNKTLEMDALFKDLKNEFEALPKKGLLFMYSSNKLINSVDPFYPIPCSIASGGYCADYYSEEHFLCERKIIQNEVSKNLDLISALTNRLNYQPLNILVFFLNLVMFFILAYLLSCMVSFGYNVIIKKYFKARLSKSI